MLRAVPVGMLQESRFRCRPDGVAKSLKKVHSISR
jgi:hypothetical protein